MQWKIFVFQHFTECENNRNFFTQSQPKRTLLFEGDPRNKSKRGFSTYIQDLNCPLGEFIFECSVQIFHRSTIITKNERQVFGTPLSMNVAQAAQTSKKRRFYFVICSSIMDWFAINFFGLLSLSFRCIYGFYILSTLNSIHCTVCDSCESNC
jgi:hypothetical protein